MNRRCPVATIPEVDDGAPITIPLTQGKVTLIDWLDRDLAQYLWSARRSRSRFYAQRMESGTREKRTRLHLHRIIMERVLKRRLEPQEQVDHINRDSLDNRRKNLRLATNVQNGQNRSKQRNNTSGYKGVSWDKARGRWRAFIQVGGTHKTLGRFDEMHDAVKARRDAEILYFGEFARKEGK